MNDQVEQLIVEPAELAGCCAHLETCRHFGLDTEFVGEESYHPKLCLVQVATEEKLFLIDPFTVGPLDAFWKIVVDPASQVIVHAGREEVRLCHLWCGQAPSNLFDLQIAAGLVGLPYPLGHGPLVGKILKIQLSKGETLTEWRNRPLTRSQISYALDDVRYLLPLWKHLQGKLEKLGRVDWAREEFTRLTLQATPEAPAMESEKWRKLRGIGSLDRRRLAMVRELFYWREQAAAEANRPARTIVRDDLLIEIARRSPTKERDLHVVRGLARRYAPAILKALEKARSLPLEACPPPIGRDQDPPQIALVANILNAVLADFSARIHLAPNLVATINELRMLVRARMLDKPMPEESLLTSGWRAAHVLPDLQSILEGRRGLRIADVKSETPFSFFE
jgi:ribonuclease D